MWTPIGKGLSASVYQRGSLIAKLTDKENARYEIPALMKLKKTSFVPKLVGVDVLPNKVVIYTEAFPGPVISLYDYLKTKPLTQSLYDAIERKVQILHGLGVSQGDLHGDNIMINPRTRKVYIIDFGKSIMWGRAKTERGAFYGLPKAEPHNNVMTYGPVRSRMNLEMLKLLRRNITNGKSGKKSYKQTAPMYVSRV
jgi:serine/threonine protein kinase